MPIAPTDIALRLSVKTGSAGDTTASSEATSLGKYVSSTVITTAQLNNLFDDVTGSESAAGDVEYRCFFVINNNATLTAQNATIEVLSQTAGGGTVDLATDNIAVSAKGSSSAQAAEIANEQTAPTGTSAFGAGPLALGNLAPGQVKAVWARRTVTAGAAATDPDGLVVRVNVDTLP